jgi:hypothetical protein
MYFAKLLYEKMLPNFITAATPPFSSLSFSSGNFGGSKDSFGGSR